MASATMTALIAAHEAEATLPQWFLDLEHIDTHVHIVDLKAMKYNAVELTQVPSLAKQWSEAMYKEDCGITVPLKAVFVEVDVTDECMEKEAKWVAPMCADPASVFEAMVVNVPVEKGAKATAKFLRRLDPSLTEQKDNQPAQLTGPIRGVRRLIQDRKWEACVQTDWVYGVQQVLKLGLPFEVCIRGGAKPGQYRDAYLMAFACTSEVKGAVIVLDHMGKPDVKGGQRMKQWLQFITDFSKLPNTVCKISGLVTEADLNKWSTADLEPYVTHCLTTFGFERCMFGSDWFVCNLAGGRYALHRWKSALCSIVDNMKPPATSEQKAALFRDTAKRVYRL